jgi:hypothetical protein
VESSPAKELHGIRISAVVLTDTDLEFLLSRTSSFNTHLKQLIRAFLNQISEGVVVENFRIPIG